MDWNVTGGPSWIRSDRFDVTAKASVMGNLTEAQLRPMLQTLLADRFKLKVHESSKEVAGHALTITGNGPKLKRSAASSEQPDSFRMNFTGLHGQAVSMKDFARYVAGKLGLVAVDQTGLPGLYDVDASWSVETDPSNADFRDAYKFALFGALQDQLGAKTRAKANPGEDDRDRSRRKGFRFRELAPVDAILVRDCMTEVTEIAPDVFRISVFAPQINLQFNHFLIRDDEPVLFHTGLRSMFPLVHEAVARVIDPAAIRHIGFSHFESDECGALNSWLEVAPNAAPVCGLIGALVSVNDFAIRPARSVTAADVLPTGKYRFRFLPTPHVPHGWDAGVLLEETQRTLFCSDLFHQWGEREPLTSDSLTERSREALLFSEAGPFAGYVPYTHKTGQILAGVAEWAPRTLAVMHGSSFSGDGRKALLELASVMEEVLGPGANRARESAAAT